VSWYAPNGSPLDWGQPELAMTAYVAAPSRADDPDGLGRDMVMMFNSTGEIRQFSLPEAGRGMLWNLFVDTAADSPEDIYPDADGPMPPSNRVVEVRHHSLKVFVCHAATV
jgi:glycogen operon protein